MAPAHESAPPSRTIRLLLEYDGTKFHGWQVQPRGPTIQGELEAALLRITGKPVRVSGSGRTDAGVHALGQVASFTSTARLDAAAFRRALNSLLPRAITVLEAQEAPRGFEARFAATGKLYRYRVLARSSPSPLERERSWHVPQPLDLAQMRAAASHLVGRHDFSAFRATGCAAANPVRTLRLCAIARDGDLLIFELEAEGFLRMMVRNIVGTLVETGRGRYSAGEVREILGGRDRARAGIAAPPQGLYLVHVGYDR